MYGIDPMLNGRTARESFVYQLELIKLAWIPGTILVGDFNLNWDKRFDYHYSYKLYYEDFERILGHLSLFQLLEHTTWRRVVNGALRESVLDHLYVRNYYQVGPPDYVWPLFGDHAAITFTIDQEPVSPEPILKRDWRGYSPQLLCHELSVHDWTLKSDSVQDLWNELENQLIISLLNLVYFEIINY